ncbi:MAG: hypothetical protein WCF03_06160 [Nitrososphaeraceae archaeon]
MKRKHVQNVIRSSIGFSLAKIDQILPTLVQKGSYDHPNLEYLVVAWQLM